MSDQLDSNEILHLFNGALHCDVCIGVLYVCARVCVCVYLYVNEQVFLHVYMAFQDFHCQRTNTAFGHQT